MLVSVHWLLCAAIVSVRMSVDAMLSVQQILAWHTKTKMVKIDFD
jgi:hypothetical protein